MRGLTIIVAGADPSRLHGALSLAAAQAALGATARIFLQADAVGLLRTPLGSADDGRYSAVGMPTLGDLLGEAAGLGVEITACQSGLALAGMSAAELPGGIETGGLVELLASRPDDQLVMA